jgi:hypothetical protein
MRTSEPFRSEFTRLPLSQLKQFPKISFRLALFFSIILFCLAFTFMPTGLHRMLYNEDLKVLAPRKQPGKTTVHYGATIFHDFLKDVLFGKIGKK